MLVNKSLPDLLRLTKSHVVYTAGLGHVVEEIAIERRNTGRFAQPELTKVLWRNEYRHRHEEEVTFYETEEEAKRHVKDQLGHISVTSDQSPLRCLGDIGNNWFFKACLFITGKKKSFEDLKRPLCNAYNLIDQLPKTHLPTVRLPDSVCCVDVDIDQELYVLDTKALLKGVPSTFAMVVKQLSLNHSIIHTTTSVKLDVQLIGKPDTLDFVLVPEQSESGDELPVSVESASLSKQNRYRVFTSKSAADRAVQKIREPLLETVE